MTEPNGIGSREFEAIIQFEPETELYQNPTGSDIYSLSPLNAPPENATKN